MKIKNNKKAISLIVLVITIIVMIVLAGAIILSLNNSGIIQKANKAVEATDESTVKELAQLAWAEAYADGVRTVDGEDGFQARIKTALDDNGVDTTKYAINVTTTGVTVRLLANTWIKDGMTLKKGNETLNIGQEIIYTATGTDYDGTWRVLGADENGNLLIMSTSDVVSSHKIGYDSSVQTTTADRLKECQNDWLNGADELDGICEKYGNGTGALKARSITIEDIDNVMGYDPTIGTKGKPYGIGTVYQYGNVVTYSYNGTKQPSYSSKVVASGTLKEHTSGFYYYNGSDFTYIEDLSAGTSGKSIVTFTSTYYNYIWKNFIDAEANPDVVEMVFGEYNEETDAYSASYWLASQYFYTGAEYIGFGMHNVLNGVLKYNNITTSDGGTYSFVRGVRAVVTLSSDLMLADLT